MQLGAEETQSLTAEPSSLRKTDTSPSNRDAPHGRPNGKQGCGCPVGSGSGYERLPQVGDASAQMWQTRRTS